MKEIAILGPTASGKTSLSIKLANKFDANILSLDSLSIYKEIDIASAKPTKKERGAIKHFGIDEFFPDTNFSVSTFFEIYDKAKKSSVLNDKNLIIVGGSGFYLKSLLTGLSPKPHVSKETAKRVAQTMQNIESAFIFLEKNDEIYAKKISSKDRYRIEKWFEIYFQTGMSASSYFKKNQQKPVIQNIDIFEIDITKETLGKNIETRTKEMLNSGLIDEVVYLEKTYTRAPNSMKSIGIRETLEFLDGFIDKKELVNKIAQNTVKLAKRQRTFNSTQFAPHAKGDTKQIYIEASNSLE